MRIVLTLTLLLLANMALPADAGGGHSNEIPGMVKWQIINLVILGAILYKTTKQPLVDFFKNRQAEYLRQAEKSKALFQEAEKEYHDIKLRLDTINKTADESVEKARKEADGVKKQIISEAQATAARIKDETQATVKLEGQKTTAKAKNDIVLQALAQARNVLTTDIGGQDHQKLQTDFNKNIEAVSP